MAWRCKCGDCMQEMSCLCEIGRVRDEIIREAGAAPDEFIGQAWKSAAEEFYRRLKATRRA